MTKKTEQIFQKIQENDIQPKAKWRFLLKNYFVWSLFGLVIIVGALAVSVIIFLLTDNDWEAHQYLNKSFWSYFFLSLPYLWLVLLIGLSSLAYFNYKHTKYGYRFNPFLVVAGSILISLILGGILFYFKLGNKIDQVLYHNMPFYKNMVVHKEDIWSQPEKGMLAGKIIKIESNDNFIIEDLLGNKWQIIGESIEIKNRVNFELGEVIKIFGVMQDDRTFKAIEIRPWEGRGQINGEMQGGGQHRNESNNIK